MKDVELYVLCGGSGGVGIIQHENGLLLSREGYFNMTVSCHCGGPVSG